MNKDEEHLKLLSVFHYVVGGIAGFFACFPVIHLIMGIVVLAVGSKEVSGGDEIPVVIFGLLFTMIPLIIILCGWAFAICMIISGRYLARRKCYKFCFAVASISCAFIPCGTVLGVFTIIVLMRPSVKELFAAT